jgi:hypothetical protein
LVLDAGCSGLNSAPVDPGISASLPLLEELYPIGVLNTLTGRGFALDTGT